MSAHLQRLYDAGGAYTAVDARPAQVSSSPLLAVDQRLASPAYAAAFLLGVPGEAEQETGEVAAPDLVVRPVQAPPVPVPVPVDAPAAGRMRPPTAVTAPPPTREEALAPPPPRGPDARPPTSLAPLFDARTEAPTAVPDVRPAPDPGHPGIPEVPVPRPEEEGLRDGERTSRTTEPRPSLPRPGPVRDPSLPSRVDPVRTATETAIPPPSPASPPSLDRESPTRPALLHPVPASLPDPLPPVPVEPPPAAPGDLAAEVHRLVREAMSSQDTGPGTSRDRERGPAGDRTLPGSRPRTAEAMSVIGPLDRPARATTLYGLRLR